MTGFATRRTFLAGLGAALAAPAVIRTPGLLMPVRSILQAPAFAADLRLDFEHALLLVYNGRVWQPLDVEDYDPLNGDCAAA